MAEVRLSLARKRSRNRGAQLATKSGVGQSFLTGFFSSKEDLAPEKQESISLAKSRKSPKKACGHCDH